MSTRSITASIIQSTSANSSRSSSMLPMVTREAPRLLYESGTTWLRHPLDKGSETLTAADAERRDTKRLISRLEVVDQRSDQASTAATERMPQSNRAAMRVELFHIDAKHFDDRERLGGERIVQLDDIDIAQLQARALEHFADRRDGADAHDVWSDACYSHRADLRQGCNTQVARLLCRHHHHGGSAIVERAGVACCNCAALDKGRLKVCQLL